MSLVVLAADCDSTWIAVRELQSEFDVAAVVLESRESRKKFLKRRLKRLGFFTVVGQILFQLLTRILQTQSADRRDDIINSNDWNTSPPKHLTIHRVPSVNGAETHKLLAELDPSVLVINGTRILGRKLLAAVECPIINMHAGITPRYRGVHGGYWALARGDKEHAGVTVHLVDAGVDTGDVLYQASIEATEEDDFTTYPLLQIEAGLPLLVQAVTDARAGQLSPSRIDGPSELFYHPTVWGYLWRRIVHRIR